MKVYFITLEDLAKDLGISLGSWNLDEYLKGGRKDVLENPDLFKINVRTRSLNKVNFGFFQDCKSRCDADVLLLAVYLELFHYNNCTELIDNIICHYTSNYPTKIITGYWNHDDDSSEILSSLCSYPNFRLLTYNTSRQEKNELILPFWSYGNIPLWKSKSIFCNYVATLNNKLREQLYLLCHNKAEIHTLQKCPYKNYVRILQESYFTFCPRGQGLSSYRFFEALRAGSIPVLFADKVKLPFENTIDYSSFIIRINEQMVDNYTYIKGRLQDANIVKMQKALHHFYHYFDIPHIQYRILKFLTE